MEEELRDEEPEMLGADEKSQVLLNPIIDEQPLLQPDSVQVNPVLPEGQPDDLLNQPVDDQLNQAPNA